MFQQAAGAATVGALDGAATVAGVDTAGVTKDGVATVVGVTTGVDTVVGDPDGVVNQVGVIKDGDLDGNMAGKLQRSRFGEDLSAIKPPTQLNSINLTKLSN